MLSLESKTTQKIQQFPEVILLSLEPQEEHISELEYTLDVNLINSELLALLIEAMSNQNNALTELDYYCLDLFTCDYYESNNLLEEFKEVVEHIREIGHILFKQFLLHKLYVDEKLVYTLAGIRPGKHNCLFLKRRDLFLKDLTNELKHKEFFHHAKINYP
jgi:hypothetical protein